MQPDIRINLTQADAPMTDPHPQNKKGRARAFLPHTAPFSKAVLSTYHPLSPQSRPSHTTATFSQNPPEAQIKRRRAAS